MSLIDEKNLVILALISGVFILVTLSSQIGSIYFAMAAVYAIAIALKLKVFEFSRTNNGLGKIVFFGILLVGLFIAGASIVLGGQEVLAKSVTFFASTFLTNFTIDNAFIKLFVFGVFIPIVETLFFFGVIFPRVLEYARARNSVRDLATIVSIVLVAGIATSFHFVVRLLNDTGLLSDLVFFGLSALLVIKQKEMSGAAAGHILINTYVMASILGFIPRLV